MNTSERVYSMLADSDMTVAQIANKLKQQNATIRGIIATLTFIYDDIYSYFLLNTRNNPVEVIGRLCNYEKHGRHHKGCMNEAD